jgi:hypothetical protein
MNVNLTLCEIENLIMMHEFCKRWYDHEYARNAAQKLAKVRNEYIVAFGKEPEPEQLEGTLF